MTGHRVPPKLARACRDLLGAHVVRVEYPGGRSRKSCRLVLHDGRSAIATRRRDEARTAREIEVLRELAARGAPVPRVLAAGKGLVIQEDLGRRRLSQVLNAAGPDGGAAAETERALDAALHALAAVHRAAGAAGLEAGVPDIGADEGWLAEFVAWPVRSIGEWLDLPAPDLPVRELTARVRAGDRPRFVKWDSRPGNAVVRDDGAVAWFDWEHCGRRNALDDLAWLLGDEFTPELPAAAEERLLARHLSAFADGPLEAAGRYLAVFGALHMCVRLALILSLKEDEPWWDWDYCLDGDKVGVARHAAQRTARRAARWAARDPLTERLAPWLARVDARLEDSDEAQPPAAAE